MYGMMLLALLCNAHCPATIADTATSWRYDLRTGDHLVYHEIFRQEIDGSAVYGLGTARDKPFGSPFVSAARYEWTSHLLVLSATGDRMLVGVQRNRARDDSISTSLDTASALSASDRTRLQSRLRGRARFAQANLLTTTGDARQPWAARREMRSKILWDAFELPSLPSAAVHVGDKWQSTDPFAFEMHVAGADTLGGETCLRAEGTASAVALIPRQVADSSQFHLTFWYCPATHLVRRVVLDGTYPDVNHYKVHESAVFELSERTHGESTAEWMRSAELRQGALQGAALGDSSVIASVLAAPGIDSLFAGADTASMRLLLGLRYRANGAPFAHADVAAARSPVRFQTRCASTSRARVHPRPPGRPSAAWRARLFADGRTACTSPTTIAATSRSRSSSISPATPARRSKACSSAAPPSSAPAISCSIPTAGADGGAPRRRRWSTRCSKR